MRREASGPQRWSPATRRCCTQGRVSAAGGTLRSKEATSLACMERVEVVYRHCLARSKAVPWTESMADHPG